MRVPLSWLSEYVDITLPVEELARRLTDAGLEVADVVRTGDWQNVFVGQVVELRPHPNADRLVLATVDLGGERQTVVCGAPNVAVGQKVAFAKEGAVLIDPRSHQPAPLRRAVIRGVESAGMICSELELGLSEDHSGIMVLPDDAPLGIPLSSYLGETVLELEIRPNRPDALSVLGIAREVAALSGAQVREPPLDYEAHGPPVRRLASVQVEAPDLCPRYVAAVVTGVRIGPSPSWMQRRLEAAGLRPINNVVDITNYVMLEMGQPLHAFDLHKLEGSSIVVRRAREGETLTLLDGSEARLRPDMLVIADARRPVAVAGVMGGANSEVDEGTTAVLLESATFFGPSVRRTAQALKLRTEASLRFEKGLSPLLPIYAARRAVRLMVELCGGKAARGIIDIFPQRHRPSPVHLTAQRLRTVLGMDVPREEVERALSALGFRVGWRRPATYVVTPPYWRTDVRIADDVAEEVARVVGYDRIPSVLRAPSLPPAEREPLRELRERLRDALAQAGMQEVITYPLSDRETLARALSPEEMESHPPLRLANPMSRELEFLRTTLRAGLLRALARNQRSRPGLVALFEVGRVFLPRPDDLPREVEMAAGVVAGPRPDRWGLPRGEPADFFDAKGMLETALASLGIEAQFVPAEHAVFLPGSTAAVVVGGQQVGLLGQVHPEVARAFEVEGDAYLFELDLERLLPHVPGGRLYRPISRFPPVREDLAVVVDAEVPAGAVRSVIESSPLVVRAELFDVYTGPPVPEGKKSLAFAVTYQALDRTPSDEEVARERRRIVAQLERELGASLRG
ncbi:MAG: phenylalanine--tRNA ligase subunit beta [Dehalococcoidia bacterium]|nr:phenylalanine--tRNA ligase subunit beta [Dehalococcoidia bacterium]MDW8008710.1 phenylalanine--tRNA ligase subunit beta [Chloroflexota bacterium]